jgi:hypothetical protein
MAYYYPISSQDVADVFNNVRQARLGGHTVTPYRVAGMLRQPMTARALEGEQKRAQNEAAWRFEKDSRRERR